MGIPYAEVIGDPIAHSKSPLIHKFWLERLGLEGDYRRAQVRPGELEAYFESRRQDPDWRGCNVTMPHKSSVLAFVSNRDAGAKEAHAANTIVAEPDSGAKAFNTDILAVATLLSGLPRADYPNHVATYVYIIGAGGAARAASLGALHAGYHCVQWYNRNADRAKALAAMFGCRDDAGSLEEMGPIRNEGEPVEEQRYSHIIINASSMGMEEYPEVPVDLAEYYPDTIVFDMVYHPPKTGLLRQAHRLGLRTIDGLDMLVAQAGHAFELFFGAEAPREYDQELRKLLTR